MLDVGTGSGYQAAVLAELAAEVHSIERIPELAETGAREPRRGRLRGPRPRARRRRDAAACPEHAPFDAIAVAAAALEAPPALYDQLEPRGRLVVPVGGADGQWLEVVVRTPEGPAVRRTVPCRFVPLVAGH